MWMWRLGPNLGTGCLVLAACSPVTASVDEKARDLAPVQRDLGTCLDRFQNLVKNPSFEAESDGMAHNTGAPVSTISDWDGCCTLAGSDTVWTVSKMHAHCGTNAVLVKSQNASAHVLNQTFHRPGDVGQAFVLSGWIWMQDAGADARLKLDVWDLHAPEKKVAETEALTSANMSWFRIKVGGTVPNDGNFQVRINSSGSLVAYVDDLSLVIP